jgi:hypothetical protein
MSMSLRSHAGRPPAVHVLLLALGLFLVTAAGLLAGPAGGQPARAQAQAHARASAAGPAKGTAGLAKGAAGPADEGSIGMGHAAPGICTTPRRRYRRAAARMSRGIEAALRGRSSVAAVTVADTRTGITCQLHPGWHFHSASIVKVIILETLLHDLGVRHRYLTREQITLTTEMITESDNDAATTLWNEDGMANLRRFLDLAKMTHTELDEDGYWGLTRVTAQDEMLLLRLLTVRSAVLDYTSRQYALRLMAHVIPAQRWGVPAGAPAGVTVHVKNGWLPDPVRWVINSIGVFTSRHRVYRIAVLTRNNPNMDYGVDTVQGVAEVINADLNPGRKPAVLPSAPYPSWGTPDERIPR